MRYCLGLLLLLFGGSALAAEACHNMKIFLSPTNSFSTSAQTLTFNARVQANVSGGGCDYFITISYGSSSSYANRSVKYGSYSWPYQIAKDAAATQIIKTFPDVSGCADVICGNLPSGNGTLTQDNNYQFILDTSNLWRKYGSYSDNYTLRLYRGTPSSYSLMDQATVNVTFMASKKADISLVDSGASFDLADTTQTLNFGNMTGGEQGTADLIMKYNAGCTLYASSQNNGSMKHSTQNQYVSYTMKMNGATVNLAGTSVWPHAILYSHGVSPANGDVNPIVVTVGSTAGKTPGTYTDTITFTVQSNE